MVAYVLKPAGVSLLAGFLLATLAGGSQNKMPAKVLEALKTRFPNAEIEKWTREKEGDVVLYDIEFRQAGQKYEADIREDGTIDNWEREIAIKDLPAAVRNAVDARYAKAKLKEAMVITAVKGGKDVLEGYEITLETAEKKPVEVTIAPDGRVLEDPGQKK